MPESLFTAVTVPAQPQGAVRVYLVFNPTRATLVGSAPGAPVMLAESPGSVGISWVPGISWADRTNAFGGRSRERFPHVLILNLAPGALASPRRLNIESLDERPELAMCISDLGNDTCVVQTSSGDSGCLDTSSLDDTLVAQPAGTVVSDVEQYMVEVEQAIVALADDATRRYSWFFFDLDRKTEAKLRAYHLAYNAPLIDAVDNVHSTVHDRLQNRLQELKSAPGACVPGVFIVGSDLRQVTDMFFGLLDQHIFAGGPFVLAEVERAFERFASGDLRLRTASGYWSTQPSSGWYFLFAELALYGGLEVAQSLSASDLTAAQRAQWRDLANVLVRTQELFLRAYDLHNVVAQPCPPPASLERPKPADYCGCSWAPIANLTTECAALAGTYAGLTHDALTARATANAAAAFPGWSDEIDPCP